jgi:hypothetical protein
MDHWRSLLAAIAPGVAVATVAQGVLSASAGAVILDGSFVARPGWQATVTGVIWFLAWTLSLGAAMIVMRGVLVDAPVRAAFALTAAVRRWGVLLGTVLVIGLLLVMSLLLAAFVEPALGPLALGVLILGAALGLSTVAALPLAALAPDKPLVAASRAWELGVGKRWNLLFLGLGVAVPGLAITWVQARIGSWAAGPVTAFLLTLGLALLSVIVIGLQGSILARWYVHLDGDPDGGPRSLGSRPRPDRWRLGGALLVAAAVAVSGIALANPWGVPVLAASSPADDDPGVFVALGGALLPDGRRLTVAHDHSDSTVTFEICGREPFCDTKLHKTFARPGLMWEYRAAVAMGDGLAVVAAVQQSGDPAAGAKLIMWQCPTLACERTSRVEVGAVNLSSHGGGMWLAMDLDDRGRPLIAWGTAEEQVTTVFRCDTPTCEHPVEDQPLLGFTVDGQWLSPAGIGFDAQHRLVAAVTQRPQDGTSGGGGLRIRIAEPP